MILRQLLGGGRHDLGEPEFEFEFERVSLLVAPVEVLGRGLQGREIANFQQTRAATDEALPCLR